ncbi:MAG: hypothetical protein IRZ31_12445 [Thermogemmatispora sp.]|uniref:hypothetical protein n=1 Tax=Thermogemmatispora sp. TaxID=1968838 RepID=UPI002606B8AF|nr:hypothetical protein [Thermogemmatispora sp.]MBX5457702.1 hypothetical protein [Thermogemmatispora sp.]
MATAPQPASFRAPGQIVRPCARCRLRDLCLTTPQPIVLPRLSRLQWAAQLRCLLSHQTTEEEERA